MDPVHKKEIEKIIGQIKCPKDFKCYESGFQVLCKARDVGLETHLECLEAEPYECEFSVRFGGLYYCHCPLRVYLAKKLHR